jgi:hypothetical protein
MADFFGTNKVEITVRSGRTLNGVAITATDVQALSAHSDEIIEARIWGGIHFRTRDETGAAIGKDVAQYVRRTTSSRFD